MKTKQVFKIGSIVEWESNSMKKRGKVVAVIPAHDNLIMRPHITNHLLHKSYKEFEKYNRSRLSDGLSRNHESYLILVGEKYLYWPRVSQLKLVKKGVKE